MASEAYERLDNVLTNGQTPTVKKLNVLLRAEYLNRLLKLCTWAELDALIKNSDFQLGVRNQPVPEADSTGVTKIIPMDVPE